MGIVQLTGGTQRRLRDAADGWSMNAALLTVTLSAAVAAAAVAVRGRLAPRPVPVRVERTADWNPHVSSGCGR